MPNGDLSFEEFMKLYPQFDETFIRTMMGKGLRIRVDPNTDVPKTQQNTIFIPPPAVGDATSIEHEMVHALTVLDPEALKSAGFSTLQTFGAGIKPGSGMDTPGNFLRGLASLIAPNTTTRMAESLAISAAGQEAYPGYEPSGERRQFDFMFKNKALPEAQASAESADRAMLQSAKRMTPPPVVTKRLPSVNMAKAKSLVPRMRPATTTRRGGLQEF